MSNASSSSLPTAPPSMVPLAIIGGTGLSSLPSPPFTPVASIPLSALSTPWGTPSSPITILRYSPTSPSSSINTTSHPPAGGILVAFLARHGEKHHLTPTEIPQKANVAALKKLGVKAAIGWSAVGSLREEVAPRDFLVGGGVIDWTKGFRPSTFFENGIVGHVSMADPFDKALSETISKAISAPGVLQGNDIKVHEKATVICIEGPQFSTRAESILYRNLPTEPPISCIGMTSVPECKLYREAEIAYALVCMSTDYDSWHETNEGVSVEMVMGHMTANSENAKRAIAAILEEVGREDVKLFKADRLTGRSRGGVMGLENQKESKGLEAVERLRWLFGDEWVKGK